MKLKSNKVFARYPLIVVEKKVMVFAIAIAMEGSRKRKDDMEQLDAGKQYYALLWNRHTPPIGGHEMSHHASYAGLTVR